MFKRFSQLLSSIKNAVDFFFFIRILSIRWYKLQKILFFNIERCSKSNENTKEMRSLDQNRQIPTVHLHLSNKSIVKDVANRSNVV